MPLYEGDVSEFVQPPKVRPVELIITIGDLHGRGRGPVTAEVDGGNPVTGEFVVPEVDWERAEPPPTSTVDVARVDDTSALIGSRLFDALFAGRLRRCWAETCGRAKDTSSGVRLTVVSGDREVQRLAWELLYDRVLLKGFVMSADGWELARSVPHQPPLPAGLLPRDGLRTLVVTFGRAEGLDHGLLRTTFPGAPVITMADPRGTELRDRISDWRPELVHIEGRPVLPAEALRDHRPRLVVMRSKYTDVVAPVLAEQVPCVIGMRGSPPRQSRDMFVENFYRALAQGSTVRRAMSAGRAQQMVFAKALGADWSAPVGYIGSPGGIITPDEPQPNGVVPISKDGRLPDGTPELRALQVALDMHTHSLRALRDRWQASTPQEWPEFITDQVEDLETRIAGIRSKLGDES